MRRNCSSVFSAAVERRPFLNHSKEMTSLFRQVTQYLSSPQANKQGVVVDNRMDIPLVFAVNLKRQLIIGVTGCSISNVALIAQARFEAINLSTVQ